MKKVVLKKSNKIAVIAALVLAIVAIAGCFTLVKAFDFWGEAAKQAGNRAYDDNKSGLGLSAGNALLGNAQASGYCSGDEPIDQIGCNSRVETLSIGGLETTVNSGDLGGKSSTTILSLKNPFGSTSTIDLVMLTNVTAATTTYTITCGTSTTAYAPSSLTASIISSGSITSSTNFHMLENDITTVYGANTTAGTVNKIMVQATDYLICLANESNTFATSIWATSTNSFAGTYKVRWFR